MTAPFHLTLACRFGDPADPRMWSGTPARLRTALQPLVAGCSGFGYPLPRPLDVLLRGTSRLFGGWNCARHPWFNAAFERRFRSGWRSLSPPPEVCLHLSDLCLPADLPGRARHYLYTDATLPGLARHQPRLVRPEFLRAYLRLTRRYLQRVGLVFTLNEWARRSFINDYGLPPDRVINAGFGIDLAAYDGPKDFARPWMVIVLRRKLEELKGLNLLLAAWPAIRRALPEARLAVVGTQLEGPPSGVTCHDQQPRETTIELMQQASLFTMPALGEPNGIVYPEALACRTPVLGLNRLAFPELCGHGEFGFVVHEADPAEVARTVIEAFRDRERLRTMGEAGQRFVLRNYTWPRTAGIIVDAVQADQAAGSRGG